GEVLVLLDVRLVGGAGGQQAHPRHDGVGLLTRRGRPEHLVAVVGPLGDQVDRHAALPSSHARSATCRSCSASRVRIASAWAPRRARSVTSPRRVYARCTVSISRSRVISVLIVSPSGRWGRGGWGRPPSRWGQRPRQRTRGSPG